MFHLSLIPSSSQCTDPNWKAAFQEGRGDRPVHIDSGRLPFFTGINQIPFSLWRPRALSLPYWGFWAGSQTG